MSDYLTAAFYKFVGLPDFAALRKPLLEICEANNVKGTILLAIEGINSTIAGPAAGVNAVLSHLRRDPRLADLQHKQAWSSRPPFHRMKVKLKREIVTMGVPDIDPVRLVGTYVKPEDWNSLISNPEVVLIDTRNDYEVQMGTFMGAIDPKIKNFSSLPAWLRDASSLREKNGKKPKVAMFCTGGIRCEKSTALLRQHGYDEVYHLEGGILKYLETVSESQSLWQGQCFVFDERVSVGHGLLPGPHGLCRACRQPLNEPDRAQASYVPGVSCPKCVNLTSETQKSSARERQRQWELAKSRAQGSTEDLHRPRHQP